MRAIAGMARSYRFASRRLDALGDRGFADKDRSCRGCVVLL
jgi:hypothetical protein